MVTPDKIKLSAPSFAATDGISHGFFTRQGGVSGGIYASLNCGPGSRDDAANVTENRARVADLIGAERDRLLSVQQQHSARVVIAEKPWKADAIPQADAIVTATPGLAIGVLTADCAPVLFYDPEARVIGAAHAGWRGALSGIVEATIEAMQKLGARKESIAAAIGPAISQRTYEVGHDFMQNVLAQDSDAAPYFAIDEGSGEPHFDLAGYVGERLARAGVGDVSDLGLCTYCDETRLFSYRRSQHHGENDYGRQISAILLA